MPTTGLTDTGQGPKGPDSGEESLLTWVGVCGERLLRLEAARWCRSPLMMNFVMDRCFCWKMNISGARLRVMRLLLGAPLSSLAATHCQHGPTLMSHSKQTFINSSVSGY
ncbi:hypothetical protein EYF80_003295 [Liparis tanakae]|uniref:Uncharacterized protein n=1 Tax=Liparis tanakae TaxID=230148 RepID=A0A4Z2J838_9TELE|nr:hypothetical protein EYF80_003295 [Liparis tanakae]